MKAAFTLLEVLFSIAVLALLVAIAVPATSRATLYAARTKSVSNLRQLGVAAHLYANEHDQKLPGQFATNSLLPPLTGGSDNDRWPKLLCAYLTPSDPRVFLDTLDPTAAQLPASTILSNDSNNTGYIYNGFDDLLQDGQPLTEIPLSLIENPVNVVLISQKTRSAKDFYVDLLGAPLPILSSLLNPAAFDGGSQYLYVDGSVRYLKQEDYTNKLWLVNKDHLLPPLINNLRPQIAQDRPPMRAPAGLPRS